MPKRIPIFVEHLDGEIKTIYTALALHSQSVNDFASQLIPPYPVAIIHSKKQEVTQGGYYLPATGLVVESSVLQLYNDIDTAKKESLMFAAEEYHDIPRKPRNSGGYAEGDNIAGVEDITVSDDTIELCKAIASKLESRGIKVRYLYHRHGVSEKVVCNLAVIYTAMKLKKMAKEAT